MKYLIIVLLLLVSTNTIAQETIPWFGGPKVKWENSLIQDAKETRIDTQKVLVFCPSSSVVSEYRYVSKIITSESMIVNGNTSHFTVYTPQMIWVPRQISWIEDVKGCYDLSNLKIK